MQGSTGDDGCTPHVRGDWQHTTRMHTPHVPTHAHTSRMWYSKDSSAKSSDPLFQGSTHAKGVGLGFAYSRRKEMAQIHFCCQCAVATLTVGLITVLSAPVRVGCHPPRALHMHQAQWSRYIQFCCLLAATAATYTATEAVVVRFTAHHA